MLYKLLTATDWDQFDRDGAFDGAAIDHQDGYIHLSDQEQVAETARLHFAAVDPLIVVALDPDRLDPALLKWEVSRGGARFPHYYGPLSRGHVAAVTVLSLTERHQLDGLSSQQDLGSD